ncbi:immunity 49 family protein [Streptomyces sp. BE133]|uniref:immunity 49 family protein n=1 Tax=Streptomyces sp. BE133 TaxID=3002523 RepID=UPI002E788363|nr:immunity 49 family protein [Streptomyces sp. BE133]
MLQENANWVLAGLDKPKGVRRAQALNMTLVLASSRCATDPEAAQFETWEAWVTAMQTGSALFAAATAPEGGSVTVRIKEREMILPAIGPEFCAHAGAWVTTFYLALICRENERLEKLAQVPVSLLRATGAVFDEYIYSWVETLQSFWLGRQDVHDKLLATAGGTDPEAARCADTELTSRFLDPPVALFHRYLRRDHEEFTIALADVLRWHKEYWTTTEDRAVSSDALVALGPLAIACLAHDAGFPIEVESEYLPTALLEFAWAGEIDT